jgi:hypothetical protein
LRAFFDFSCSAAQPLARLRLRNFAVLQGYVTILRRMNGLWNGSKSARTYLRRSALIVGMCCSSGLAVLASCSAVVDTDKAKLGPVPVPCEPGQVAPCPCRDGSMSMQKCTSMARYDRCACSGIAGRGGSTAGNSAMSGGRGASTGSP